MTKANRPKMHRDVVLSIVALLGLAASCVLAYLVFQHLFGLNYFHWYTKAGPLVALASAAVGIVFGGFDEDPGFISRHPLEYVGSYLQVAGVVVYSSGSTVRDGSTHSSLVDSLLALPLAFVLALSVVAWLLLIVPFQYFLFLVCGALSRRLLLQRATTEFRKTTVTHDEMPSQSDAKTFDKVWLDNGLRKKSFTLACAFSALLLQLVSWLVAPSQA